MDKKVAIIESKLSRNNYTSLFESNFEFDLYQLCSDPTVSKVLKKNVDIEINLDKYDWVLLVGAEATKYFTNIRSVTEYSGHVVDQKFIPVMNPAVLQFRQDARKTWDDTKQNVINYVTGSDSVMFDFTQITEGVRTKERAIEIIKAAIAHESEFVALDSETSSLYPRNGHVLGISICYDGKKGYYIDSDVIDEDVSRLVQKLAKKKVIIFHNAKFDLKFFKYWFDWDFPKIHDTMLQHYMLNETLGTHGLKYLAMKYTKYGDYEKPMYDWIDNYMRTHGVKKEDFSFEVIPFDVIYVYASMDAVCTYDLHAHVFYSKVAANEKLLKVYNEIMIPATYLLVEMEDRGIPFSRNRLIKAQTALQKEIEEATNELNAIPEVQNYIEKFGPLNVNSPTQLRRLLFDYLMLPSSKKTAKDEKSTDAEVLTELANLHPAPEKILKVRKLIKIKNTYIDKIIPQLDRDSKIRTNFNLHTTTSGRLSSSGKLNAQQFPRDNSLVKGCIVAPPGFKIVSGDLRTAEVYVAAVLSGDLALQEVFRSGGNFHSTIAKRVFKLPCAVEDVERLYKKQRQFAKAITFGIMYGAGAHKIWAQARKDGADITLREAQEIIDEYFATFKKLKKWIDATIKEIKRQGFTYSYFGRKRRLPLVLVNDDYRADHEVRSGLNFKVQSPASDINLLGAIEANRELKTTDLNAHIFMLVHDSILGLVEDQDVDPYKEIILRNIQRDRGISIPGCPIGVDFEVDQDYSMGKFAKQYPELMKAA